MKIAMIYPSLDSEKAISNYSLNLVEAQNKLTKMDSITYSAGSWRNLFKQMKKIKGQDVVHIQHEYNLLGGFGIPFFFLYFLLNLFNINVVTTMHTVLSQKEEFKGNEIKTFLRKILYQSQNRFISRFSKKIIVHANFFKEILMEEYGVPSEKIEVISQAIIENPKLIEKNKAKKELNLSGPVYLLIGSFIPDHGADIILKQAKDFGKTILVVANNKAVNDRNGKRITNWIEFNKDLMKKRKFDSYVRFDIKDLPNSLWWKYFSCADLVLLPYRGGIGSGIFADSIAARKPIVASNIKFFNEFATKYKFIKIAKKDSDFPRLAKEFMKHKTYSLAIRDFEKYIKDNGITPISKKYYKLYSSLK